MTNNENASPMQDAGQLVVRIDANADALHATFDAIEKRIEILKGKLKELEVAAAGAGDVTGRQTFNMECGLAETVAEQITKAAPAIAAMAHQSAADAMSGRGNKDAEFTTDKYLDMIVRQLNILNMLITHGLGGKVTQEDINAQKP